MAQPLTAQSMPDGRPLVETARDAGLPCSDNVSGPYQNGPLEVRNPSFLRYLQSHFAGAVEERFHATYCDGEGHYLYDEVLVRGSPVSVATRGRLLFGRALALGASGLLLAHNHPSGRCLPSRDDLFATNRLRDIASGLDIVLLDHLILTQDEIYSMRHGGCL